MEIPIRSTPTIDEPKAKSESLRTSRSIRTYLRVVQMSGKITAKGKGSCVVYVYAHNGVSKSVKVIVK